MPAKKKALRHALDQLDPKGLRSFVGESLLLTKDASEREIQALLGLARAFSAFDAMGIKTPIFNDELYYALFFDQSTRTKSSWAGAAARLGACPVIVDGSSTQVSHGETAEETGAMLGMNAHALGIRHDLILGEGNSFMRDAKKGIDDYLAKTGSDRIVPIVNLQCDIDHPTQTLADMCWLQERFPAGIAGRTITVSWAYSPSYAKPLSVPQGLISLLTRFGAHVRLAHPEGYDLLEDVMVEAESNAARAGGSFKLLHDMDAAFAGADVVYPKSWGPMDLMRERVAANKAGDAMKMSDIEKRALDRNAKFTDWICDGRRMGLTKDGKALYMHCLPADIGAEVSREVLEHYRVSLAREANKKVYVIMALLAASREPPVASILPALLRR